GARSEGSALRPIRTLCRARLSVFATRPARYVLKAPTGGAIDISLSFKITISRAPKPLLLRPDDDRRSDPIERRPRHRCVSVVARGKDIARITGIGFQRDKMSTACCER